MRVILDTNILLSGLVSPTGLPARLLDAWVDRRFVLITHELQLAELREVTRRPKLRALVRPAEVGRLINQITQAAELPVKLPPVQRSRDPKDDFLLALCDAAESDFLVTGDKDDLLSLKRHGAAQIVTAATFASLADL